MAACRQNVVAYSVASQADLGGEHGPRGQAALDGGTPGILGDENDYDACVQHYAGVTAENYIERNISTLEFHAIETERLKEALRMLPKNAYDSAVVAELGSGYGRNWPLLRETFSEAIILQYEQSQANIDIAVEKMQVPKEYCFCTPV